MKQLLISTAAGLALAAVLSGQDADLVAKRDAKLQAEFLQKAAWVTDYDAAREEAKKTGKVIFAYFTRSYEH
jgi:hypothetical protein